MQRKSKPVSLPSLKSEAARIAALPQESERRRAIEVLLDFAATCVATGQLTIPGQSRASPKLARREWPTNGIATIAEACEFLQVSDRTLKKWRDLERIAFQEEERWIRIEWKELHRFAGQVKPKVSR